MILALNNSQFEKRGCDGGVLEDSDWDTTPCRWVGGSWPVEGLWCLQTQELSSPREMPP